MNILSEFETKNSPRVIYGCGSLKKIPEAVKEYGSRVLIVTDAGIQSAGYPELLKNYLLESGFEVDIFAQSKENPTETDAEECAAFARNFKPDLLVGLGGGSSMDTAKACNFIYTNGGRMEDYHGYGKAVKPMLPLVCVPTTSGVLQASTSEVYGDPEVHPQKEDYRGSVNPIGTRSCYDEGKRCAETLFFDYHRQHEVEIKVMRIFNTYGPRMHHDDGRVVSNFIVQALTGRDITIYGDGSQTRSFCYVDDLLDGMIKLMNSKAEITGPINIGNPSEFTISQLAEQVLKMTGSKSKIIYKELPSDDPVRRRPDISLASSILDWKPTIELAEGLQKTINYFKKNL